MKVKDILNGFGSIQKLSSLDLPIGFTLRVKKNVDKCQEVLDILESKRNSLIEKYNIDVKEDEDWPEEPAAEMEEALEEEIELDIVPISLKELESNNVKLSVSDLTTISWMFEFDA